MYTSTYCFFFSYANRRVIVMENKTENHLKDSKSLPLIDSESPRIRWTITTQKGNYIKRTFVIDFDRSLKMVQKLTASKKMKMNMFCSENQLKSKTDASLVPLQWWLSTALVKMWEMFDDEYLPVAKRHLFFFVLFLQHIEYIFHTKSPNIGQLKLFH